VGKAGVKETRPSAVVCNDSAHILIHCSEIESVLVLVNSFSKKKKKFVLLQPQMSMCFLSTSDTFLPPGIYY